MIFLNLFELMNIAKIIASNNFRNNMNLTLKAFTS